MASVYEIFEFFVYDTVKIILLLYIMIFLIGILRTYIPQHKMREWLSRKKFGLSYVFAALFGAVTPFCSCSSIPIFISFIRAGVPLGVTFSFLVTSPLINEYLVVLMLGFFGLKITIAYVLFGLMLGMASGVIISKLDVNKYIVEDLRFNADEIREEKFTNFRERFGYGSSEASSIVKKLWLWVVVGVGIGALIHNFIPQELIEGAINRAGIFSVPIAVLIGVPIYANCGAIVPIAVALFQKGVPLGTSLAFMMATAALSLPEAVILRRALKLPLIAIFFGIVAAGIVMMGYLFNFI